MKTYFVKDLEKGLVLTNETFAVKLAEQGTTKDGKPFYKVILIDKTGEIKAQIWADKIPNVEKGALVPGKVIAISGMVEDFKGTLQINIFAGSKVNETALDEYMEASDFDLDELWQDLLNHIAGVSQPDLRAFLDKIFADKDIATKYKVYPAAEFVHHSFQGGLLEHVVEMLDLAMPLAKYYPEANMDMVRTGIILHDIGKLFELEPAGVVVQRTKEGYLLGHLIKSYEFLLDYGKGVLEPESMIQLKHIILSHHGSLEYGSPVVPATIEASIVTDVDQLSSKTRIFQKLMRKAEGNGADFTEWDKIVGTRVYLGPTNTSGEY